MEEIPISIPDTPGVLLAREREKKGYSQDYVAGKLHLRVRIIELLEKGQFDLLPETVFVKGYIRAYAKLLGLAPEPLLLIFQEVQVPDSRKVEKALWQQRRKESSSKEKLIRLIPLLVIIAALIIVGTWWQKNKERSPLLPQEVSISTNTSLTLPLPKDNISSVEKLTSLFQKNDQEASEQ
jgi:cytoskeleton protein RodZ